MNTLVSFLKKNPQTLSKYVAFGTAVVDAVVAPLTKFMQHLLTIQDIDPTKRPGSTLMDELYDAFNSIESEDFSKAYSDKVLKKHFAIAQGKIKNLTLKQYKEMTDLSKFEDKKETPLQVVVPNPETKAPYYTVADQEKFFRMAALKEQVIQPATTTEVFDEEGKLNPDPLKRALQMLVEYAAKFENEPSSDEPKVQVSRAQTAVGAGHKFSANRRAVRHFLGDRFRRVEENKKEE